MGRHLDHAAGVRPLAIRGFDLLQRHIVAAELELHAALVQDARRVRIVGGELNLLGAGDELPVAQRDVVFGVIRVGRETVERLIEERAFEDGQLGLREWIADSTVELHRGGERAGYRRQFGLDEGREIGEAGVADGTAAGNQAGISGLPILQIHCAFEIGVHRAHASPKHVSWKRSVETR